MSRQALRAMLKRVEAVAARQNPQPFGWCMITHGEDAELAAAKWRRDNGMKPDHPCIVRVIVTGVPRGNRDSPDPALCTRESLLAEIPHVKAQLGKCSENGRGPSDAVKRTAAHWAALCAQFGIEDKI
jgi:hypothetical protein